MSRALSVNDLLTKRRRVMEFTGPWHAALGSPEMAGTWLIWGGSGSGKTRFSLQLAKYLTGFGRVAYNSLEEGDCESMAIAFEEVGMSEVAGRVTLLPGNSISEMIARLERPKSPPIVVVDSLQYLGISYKEYKALRAKFPNKLFIFISHAKGKEPYGSVAQQIRYDAMVKIRIEGFKALPTSRFGGGESFAIWAEGAENYWGVYNKNTD